MRNTERFSNRAADYARYRPSYPSEALRLLGSEFALAPRARVADLGSGTGLLTEALLRFGCDVFAVEPNPEMRAAAEDALSSCSGFYSVNAVAEDTGLTAASIDLVTAGQAFRWFDLARTRRECARILRPGGGVALIWNLRLSDTTPFLAGYEVLLQRHAPEYAEAGHRRIGEATMDEFFGRHSWNLATFSNQQLFDWEGLIGRVQSSSYTPVAGTTDWTSLETGLRELFETHQEDGRVAFLYKTEVYYGRHR